MSLLLLTTSERLGLRSVRAGEGRLVPIAVMDRLQRRELVTLAVNEDEDDQSQGQWCITRAGLWALQRPPWPERRRRDGRGFRTPEADATISAKRIGCTPDLYLARRLNGQRWCGWCRDWHAETAVKISTTGRLLAMCAEGLRAYNREWTRQRRARLAEGARR